MARLLLALLHLQTVAAWTYTEYLTLYTGSVLGEAPYTDTVTVVPTGSVSPLSSNVSTTTTYMTFDNQDVQLNLTVTDLILATGASACPTNDASCTISSSASDSINYVFYAPVTISNPPSCTQTSFTYTTSSVGNFTLGGQFDEVADLFPTVLDQATVTGSAGQALFVTTFVTTISVDLGGQPITSTQCDIYLKGNALNGLTAARAERTYLDQCVDPRRFLCPAASTDSAGACGTTWVPSYPATGSGGGGAAGNTGGAGGNGGGQGGTGSGPSASQTKASRAAVRAAPWSMGASMVALAIVGAAFVSL